MDPLTMERTVKNHMLWDQWRRDQITNLVKSVRQILHDRYPQTKLSCAVLPWPERSYFSSFQDWTRWAEEGHVDFLVTMNYTLDLRLARFLSHMAMSVGKKADVWIGLGPYLFETDSEGFQKEFKETLDLKPSGVVFFSYDSLLKQSGVVQAIKKTLEKASQRHGNRQKAA
jgi:uncharacterized lipoprotein YddW (UPF0748 family)